MGKMKNNYIRFSIYWILILLTIFDIGECIVNVHFGNEQPEKIIDQPCKDTCIEIYNLCKWSLRPFCFIDMAICYQSCEYFVFHENFEEELDTIRNEEEDEAIISYFKENNSNENSSSRNELNDFPQQ